MDGSTVGENLLPSFRQSCIPPASRFVFSHPFLLPDSHNCYNRHARNRTQLPDPSPRQPLPIHESGTWTLQVTRSEPAMRLMPSREPAATTTMKRSSRSRTSKPKPSGEKPNGNPSSGHPPPEEATPKWRLERIISGGQTGVDRAALDVAIEIGIPHGGWCPRGRRAENGIIPTHYQLKEIEGIDYSERTRKNIIESDGTLIVTGGPLQGGTLLTFNLCNKLSRPVRVILLPGQPNAHPPNTQPWPNTQPSIALPSEEIPQRDDSLQPDPTSLWEWLTQYQVRILNVAGPRASKSPGIYERSKAYLLSQLGALHS